MISVLTPTIRGREHFLAECRASVKGQTVQIHEHLTLLDDEHNGCSATMNALAGHARGDWLFILADDDLLLPACLEQMLEVATGGVHVVYSPPLVWGEAPDQFCASPPNIPAVALIAKETWEKVGGYKLELSQTEDRDFWINAQQRGANFVRFDKAPTWVYRFHGGNKSRY